MKNTEEILPSGEWEGFYNYFSGGPKHLMSTHLEFSNGRVSGVGNDDVGAYNWSGFVSAGLKVELKKTYSSHHVFYEGDADELGIWGMWSIGSMKGGFHLWPKKQAVESEELEMAVEEIAEKQTVLHK